MKNFIEVINAEPYERFVINFKYVKSISRNNIGKAEVLMFDGNIHLLQNTYDDVKKKMIAANILD